MRNPKIAQTTDYSCVSQLELRVQVREKKCSVIFFLLTYGAGQFLQN